LFSLHNEGKGLEKELSLPKLLSKSQINGRDQHEWLNLIMEFTGVNEQIDDIKVKILTYKFMKIVKKKFIGILKF
jgi:hypothetical protein